MFFHKLVGLVNVDHLSVTLLVLLMGWLLTFASINLTVFNPVKKAFADFSMTDIFYEIQNSSGVKEFNKDIVLVDMTELYDRREIARCIRDITRCEPKVFVIDLIFERPSFDEEENECLIDAISEIKDGVVSCKLVDYDSRLDCFRGVRRSFFEDASGGAGREYAGDSAMLYPVKAMAAYASIRRMSISWAPRSIRCLT